MTSVDVTPSAPSSDPPCSSSDTKSSLCCPWCFVRPQLTLGFSLPCTLPLISAQPVDSFLVRSHVFYHLCVSGPLREFPGEGGTVASPFPLSLGSLCPRWLCSPLRISHLSLAICCFRVLGWGTHLVFIFYWPRLFLVFIFEKCLKKKI